VITSKPAFPLHNVFRFGLEFTTAVELIGA